MASGGLFDSRLFIAAHKTLPFGTILRVCLDKCTNVVVLDRGPFIKGRILDLSEKAATLIGLRPRGVAVVTVTQVSADNPEACGLLRRTVLLSKSPSSLAVCDLAEPAQSEGQPHSEESR
jgi:rare lipoprotein A